MLAGLYKVFFRLVYQLCQLCEISAAASAYVCEIIGGLATSEPTRLAQGLSLERRILLLSINLLQ